MTSVNTNYGALVALQNLSATNSQLEEVQNRVNTGLKVASAKDNGAVFAIAEGLRTRVGALSSVQDGLDRATSAIDTALGAGSSIGDVLKQLKQKAIDAQTLTSTSDRQKAQADFAALRDSIDSFVNAATINGVNLVNGTNSTNGLTVLTTDIGGGSVNGGAAVEGRATTALAAGTVTTIGTLSGTTQVVGTQGAGVLGATDGDKVNIVLADPTGGSNTQQFNITLKAGQTVNDFIAGVASASGGKITASLDATNNRLVYSSAQSFTVNYTAANSGSLTAATTGAVVNELGQFFGAGAGTLGSEADGSKTITYASGASSSFQTGGGYQLATGTAFASGTTTASKLADLVATNDGTGKLTFVVGALAATQRTFNVSVNGLTTLGDLVNAVGQQTNGQVTAAYDSVSRKIVYKSAESFTGTANAAAGTKFGPGAATAGTKAPTIGAAGGGGSSGATSTITAYDFRVNGGTLSGLSSLDLTVDPNTASDMVQGLLDSLNTNLAKLGGQAKALQSQKTFLSQLSDNITKGVGLLVDADLAKESARLQALQVKQQLGAQALSIANQQPSILLSFFR